MDTFRARCPAFLVAHQHRPICDTGRFVRKLIAILVSYHTTLSPSEAPPLQLMIPDTLNNLPLYILPLVKNIVFGPDERIYNLMALRTMPVEESGICIHPRPYSITNIPDYRNAVQSELNDRQVDFTIRTGSLSELDNSYSQRVRSIIRGDSTYAAKQTTRTGGFDSTTHTALPGAPLQPGYTKHQRIPANRFTLPR
ncbi:hypothetical protein Pelo_17981 [Pelomyxa schiedti]|nr:hypothetical protein Pelo_17981 [Pelomyxa schiedti]